MNIGQQLFVIAELGNTHDGSFGQAKKMIKAAADCGVDAVKVQTHIFSAESLPDAPSPPYFSDESREEYFDRTSFSRDEYLALSEYASQDCGIEFLSSPFSQEAVRFLEEVGMSRYKIPSGEVNNIPLLREVAKTNKPVILSSGMSSWIELDLAVDTLRDNGCDELSILQCSSTYPCPPDRVGLNVIGELAKRYAVPTGYSDHTLGSAAPFAAVAMGATIIEKHFTLSTLMYGSDAQHSMEPGEFTEMVRGIRQIEAMLLNPVNKDQAVNDMLQMKRIFEKSVVTRKAITKGTKITAEMIAVKKPGTGVPARYFDAVIGAIARNDIETDHTISVDDIEGLVLPEYGYDS